VAAPTTHGDPPQAEAGGPPDPWADQRVEMPAHEFDAVAYHVGRMALGGMHPPPPSLGAFLTADLTCAEFAARLGDVLADLAEVLARTTDVRLRAWEATRVVAGSPPRSRRWRGPATRRWLEEGLAADGAEGIIVTFEATAPADVDQFLVLNVFRFGSIPGVLTDISLVAGPQLWPGPAVDDAAEQVLRLAESWVDPLRILTGGITYDRVEGIDSPFEQWYGLNHATRAGIARDRLRGYHWANLLGPGHLARLGGRDALLAAAAVHGFDARLLSRGPGEGPGPAEVLVRARGPITAFDDARLAAMKGFLAPALPTVRYSGYYGWPLRIVKDPGTAFRTVPPDGPGPRLLPQTPAEGSSSPHE